MAHLAINPSSEVYLQQEAAAAPIMLMVVFQAAQAEAAELVLVLQVQVNQDKEIQAARRVVAHLLVAVVVVALEGQEIPALAAAPVALVLAGLVMDPLMQVVAVVAAVLAEPVQEVMAGPVAAHRAADIRPMDQNFQIQVPLIPAAARAALITQVDLEPTVLAVLE